jgi:hypothetical protein
MSKAVMDPVMLVGFGRKRSTLIAQSCVIAENFAMPSKGVISFPVGVQDVFLDYFLKRVNRRRFASNGQFPNGRRPVVLCLVHTVETRYWQDAGIVADKNSQADLRTC